MVKYVSPLLETSCVRWMSFSDGFPVQIASTWVSF